MDVHTEGLGFGAEHFGGCMLGHRRRTDRLVDLADRIRAHPGGTLPAKLGDPAAYRAACRLMNHAAVTHAAVLAHHRARTLRLMAEHDATVLILHDTTELDYSGHRATALGPIGNGGGRGYEAHHSLAVSARDGRVLGLAAQLLHRRAAVPPGEGVAAKRARADRESRLWARGAEAVGPAPAGATWVDVCDRGADTFEFLEYERSHARSYVVRSKYNRALEVDADEPGEPRLLHDRLRARPARLGWTAALPARPGRRRRTARLHAAAMRVRLRAPHVRRGEHGREPLEVWAVRVWEVGPVPEGQEPLEWILLTDVPVADDAALRERVGWYERRSVIEEYHKAQKTGLGIEGLQFRTAAALQPAIALVSVAAVALLGAREEARDPAAAARPATERFGPTAVRVLSTWRHGAARELTVREFVMALGRLGGHQNRKCDGVPGWQTLWRGWERLQAMIAYELSRARSG